SFNQSATPEQTISVDDFVKGIKKQYGIELGLKGSPTSNVLSLHKIVVPEAMRNQGTGSKAMQDIIKYADSQNKTIALTPSSDFGGNKNRLTGFYKKLGFVENKGRNKDYEISESMYRAPNGRKYNQANGGTRGSITFSTSQDGSTIVLSKNADFSTFVHELGHHFLEMNM
ncbi:GNAT family N-acetyltransferase, partial [Acinetobacter baumannii]